MAQKSCEISHDLTSPSGAYERAHDLCQKAVMIEKMSVGYVGAAIENLTAEGNFGSWLRDLFHRKKVTIHLHYYERLVCIVEKQAANSRRQIDHVDDLIRIAKGRRNAVDQGDLHPDLVLSGASAKKTRCAPAGCLS